MIDERQEIKDCYTRIFKNNETGQIDPTVRSILDEFVWQWMVHHGLWNPIDEIYPKEGFQVSFPYPEYDWEVKLIARHKKGEKLKRPKSFVYRSPAVVSGVLRLLDQRSSEVHNMSRESQVIEELFEHAYQYLWLPLKQIEINEKKSKVVEFVYDMHSSILKWGDYDPESLRRHIDRRDSEGQSA